MNRKTSAFFQMIIYSFILIFLFSCCGKQVPKIPYSSPHNLFPYKAFAHIKIAAAENPEIAAWMSPEEYDFFKNQYSGSGSGIVIKTGNSTEILTAGHVCATPTIEGVPNPLEIEIFAYNWYGKGWKAEITAIDTERDLCLLEVTGIKFPGVVEIASKDPDIGEKGYLGATPLGIFVKRMPLLFDGYYGGVDPDQQQMWTIPVAPGCSGGGVVNGNGDLVGIITAGVMQFNEVALATSRLGIIEFLEEHQKL